MKARKQPKAHVQLNTTPKRKLSEMPGFVPCPDGPPSGEMMLLYLPLLRLARAAKLAREAGQS